MSGSPIGGSPAPRRVRIYVVAVGVVMRAWPSIAIDGGAETIRRGLRVGPNGIAARNAAAVIGVPQVAAVTRIPHLFQLTGPCTRSKGLCQRRRRKGNREAHARKKKRLHVGLQKSMVPPSLHMWLRHWRCAMQQIVSAQWHGKPFLGPCDDATNRQWRRRFGVCARARAEGPLVTNR